MTKLKQLRPQLLALAVVLVLIGLISPGFFSVTVQNGRLYGSLCGFSTKACPHLQAQDVRRMEIAAQAIARLLAQAEGHDVIALDD